MSEPPTFLDLLDRLTRDTPTTIHRDHGHDEVTQTGLLQQLREAVFGGMGPKGGAGDFGSRPPINASAVDLLTEITDQATTVLAIVDPHPTPLGTAEHYVRLWAGQTKPDRMFTVTTRQAVNNPAPGKPAVFDELTMLSAYALLNRWVESVEGFFNPPSTRQIIGKCPSCDAEHSFKMQDGQHIKSTALNFIRDKETYETTEARCAVCLASWSKEQFDWLARAVGASMLLSDLFEQYKDGDEVGWAVEFAKLRKVHVKKLDQLRASIQEHGIEKPILLGHDGRVWDGHHRLLIADEIGITSVPIKKVQAPKKAKLVGAKPLPEFEGDAA